MSRFTQLFRTTVGQKAVAAITGAMLFGFVILHMAGNLKTFTGTTASGVPHVDIYAAFLRTMGEPLIPYGSALWTMRIILLIAIVLHIGTVVHLAAHNREARNVHYARHVHTSTTWPARSMLASGVLLLGFVVIHILQFTTGTIDVTPIIQGEVYTNLSKAFGEWFFALFYVGAMALLGMHLYHGAWSLFQTLGFDNPDRNGRLRALAAISAGVIFLGFCSVPVLFFIGAMPAPPDAETVNAAAVAGSNLTP